MVRDRTQTAQEKATADDEEEEKPLPRYFVNLEDVNLLNRSLPLIIASRRCYTCKEADDEQPSPSAEVKPYIKRIAEHCEQTSDYLLPDTPLKEAIFRVILAGGNQDMNAEEISQILTEKWAMSPYPRDVAVKVIQQLLDNSAVLLRCTGIRACGRGGNEE